MSNYIYAIGSALNERQRGFLNTYMERHREVSVSQIIRVALMEHIRNMDNLCDDGILPFATLLEAIGYYDPHTLVIKLVPSYKAIVHANLQYGILTPQYYEYLPRKPDDVIYDYDSYQLTAYYKQ